MNLLQYVDDIIFVGEFSVYNVIVLKSMMGSFELVSCLKVNFQKSKFGGFGVARDVVEKFAKFLNCVSLSTPFVYLGIPIDTNPWRLETWESIITKFVKKLASWKHKHLLFTRRISLINSILFSLPIFSLSYFKVSETISRRLVSIQRRFLWECEDRRGKISWVEREKNCCPKENGGLGVKNILLFNSVLLAK